MQMSFQPVKVSTRRSRAGAASFWISAALFAGSVGVRADSLATDWIVGKNSSARLIAAPAAEPGVFRAGIEIRLAPDVLTYWRAPGEAGAPPEFDFLASDNVEVATVRFPTPARLDEDGVDAFGYRGRVVFPVAVKVKDAGRPATLALSLNYAVCGRICIPLRAKLALALDKAAVGSGDAASVVARLDDAEAKTPRRLGDDERDRLICIVRDAGGERPTWRLTLRDSLAKAEDLFVESDSGGYFETRRGERPNEFLIVEVEPPPGDVTTEASVTLTLAGDQSLEFAASLGANRTAEAGTEGKQ